MALLPAKSLAALTKTCRFFSASAVGPLCRLSNRPFSSVPKILSFIRFLRIGSADPRSPFIRELHFDETLVNWSAFCNRYGRSLSMGTDCLFELILKIVQQCRNLRTLHVMCWVDNWTLEAFSATITNLPLLTNLHVGFDNDSVSELGITAFRLSLKGLRKLSIERRLNQTYIGAALPPDPFLCIRRLAFAWDIKDTTLPAMLSHNFPNLQHLAINDHYCPIGSSIFSSGLTQRTAHMETIRARQKAAWVVHRKHCHNLLSLTAHQGCMLYMLAYPRPVPHVLFLENRGDYDDHAVRVTETSEAIRAAAPRLLNLHITLRERRVIDPVSGKEGRADPLMEELGTLRASRNLTHLVLIVDCRCVCNTMEEGIEHHENIMNGALRREVPGLSALSHILVVVEDVNEVYQNDKWLETWEDGCRHRLTLREHANETAALLANLSPTLRWVGVWARPYGIRAWEVRRGDAIGAADQDAHTAAALVEMAEDEAWAVVRSATMLNP
ncbi:hypothetical protein BD413DRAFT_573600 [Trametes elegans]|nr:hypothetical protein BD413DRAFT_573600 [Trametes elegans]